MPVLDRRPSKPDPVRLASFPIAPLIQGLQPRSYTWRVPFILNQGSEGACVGHGITQEAVARPNVVDFTKITLPDWAVLTPPFTTPEARAQAFAFDLYNWARRNDEWPGENYSGTSVAAGAAGAKAAGFWSEYRWTRDVLEFATAVSRRGPGVIGVDWWTGMFRPDASGFLHPTGRVEGGHCILVNGYSVRRSAFKLTNSWGPYWGSNGSAWLGIADMQRLVRDGGELLLPVRS